MAIAADVLAMLCPNVEYTLIGDNFEDIVWHNGEAVINKKEFLDGFAKYDAWKEQQIEAAKQAKLIAESKLVALGLTVDDLKALGLG